MKCKRTQIECSRNYSAKILRNFEDTGFIKVNSTLHWHNECELIYVEKGSIIVNRLDGQKILPENSVHIVNSEEIHCYEDYDIDPKCLFICIPPDFIRLFTDINDGIIKFNIYKEPAYSHILESMQELSRCKNLEDKPDVLKVKSILNNILYYMIRDCIDSSIEYPLGSDSEDFDVAKLAIIYMRQNFKRNISLNDISNYVGMSATHFSKYFKDKTEMTFSAYLRKLRLEAAINQLVYSEISVKDAAYENGFPNVNALIITCKNEYGKTPIEMRNYLRT